MQKCYAHVKQVRLGVAEEGHGGRLLGGHGAKGDDVIRRPRQHYRVDELIPLSVPASQC